MGNVKDDPLHKLMGCGNQGGFRYIGTTSNPDFCVLYSSLIDPDWPDELDITQGRLFYYGDNKTAGQDIHSRKGNLILRSVFESLHTGKRNQIPPFFVFTKGPTKRDVIFRGLAVPGTENFNQDDDLIAVWKTRDGKRFQNYRAVFSILNVGKISRSWVNDLRNLTKDNTNAPTVWKDWVKTGRYKILTAPKAVHYRLRNEQLPNSSDKLSTSILNSIISFFKAHPKREYAFEKCATEIVRLMDSNIVSCDLTRPWRDGGRDATGKYRIGINTSSILVDFALEAKCKNTNSGSGIKETSRLISRLRHRQFGIFITTSYVSEQAYKELIDDEHPVVIISGKDICEVLIKSGYNSATAVKNWLQNNFFD
ncbi:MAG TPA: restriction endonuclease [Nitrososphaeraceae archaeon]